MASSSAPRSPARPARNSGGRERGRIFPAHGVRGAPMPKVPKRWYEDFFGSDYLIRYVHPETAAQVEAIDKILHLRKGGRILDVACGAGRHTIGLSKRGDRGTGLDLSSPLLAEARKAARQAGVKPTCGQGETRQVIIDRKGTREFTASVRAYTLAELKEMLDAEGLFVHRVLGGLDLSPYTARSRRMVLYAVKGLEPEGIRTVW